MDESRLSDHEREAPHSHLIQGLSPIVFTIAAILDGLVLNWTDWLNDTIPLFV